MNAELLLLLKDEVTRIGAPLTFVPRATVPIFEESPLFNNACLWESTFAMLLVIEVQPQTVETIQQVAKMSSEWMRRYLSTLESHGKFLDGYIVFACETKPIDDFAAAVQGVESDPKICRKHVVWPEGGSWLARLHFVTTLGLPKVVENSERVAAAKMPTLAVGSPGTELEFAL